MLLPREGTDVSRVEARFLFTSEDQEGNVVLEKSLGWQRAVEIDGPWHQLKNWLEVLEHQLIFCGQHEHQRLLM